MPEFDSATLTIWMNPEGDTQANCNTLNKTGKRWISRMLPLKSNISVFANDIVNKTTFDADWKSKFWLGVENPLAPATDDDKNAIFLEQLSSTIEAGNNLYDYLFEQGLDEILTKIDAMPDGTYLKIITNFAFFSWEILSPRVPGEIDSKNAYKKLWGYRFITNYELIPDSDDGFSPPLENHNNGKPNIVLNVNPQINEELKQSDLLPNKPHFDFYENLIANGNLGRLLTSGGEIKESLLSPTNDATIIYIYCHGRNTDPFKPGCDETLELDKNITIKPDFLRKRDSDFSRGPIIFLNSCKSGAISPLSFVSFLKIFQQKKAMGILGTTINIPAIFAAAFGIKILESYMNGNYVSLALYNLRRDLLDHYNPLGLFYSLQCPDDVSAPRQNSESYDTKNNTVEKLGEGININQKSITFIVSDLHLGGGEVDPGDDHVYKGDQFAKFILTRLVETNEWKSGDIELFINGDFLDFVQVGPELYKDNLDIGWCSENESLKKLNLIIKGHEPIFNALRTFNENGNLITIAAGNHDVDLYWPAVQKKIKETIGNTNFENGEEIVSRYDGRLLIGHGHMDDPANKFKNWAKPVVKSKNSELPPRLEMCPGTKFMVKFVNLLEAKYPFADNIIPETYLAKILWKEDKIGAVLAATLLFKFMGTEPRAFLGSSTSDKVEILKQIKDYLEVPKFLNEVTSIYNLVFNLNETEKAVKSKLKEDEELFRFVNAVFINMSPEEWCPVFDKWPIKTTLSINSNDATLSIGYAGISDIKYDLREKAKSMLTENVDIVVFGHTHQPDKADFKVKKYFNPGSWTRYVNIKNIDSLALEDLADESDFPYQLNYIKVWKDLDPNKKILQSEMITFEELLGTKFKATGNAG